MDIGTVAIAVLSSGAFAAIISGGLSRWSQHAQEERDDRASRRQVRIAARTFAVHVLNARQHGFGTIDGVPSTRAALKDLLTDRDVLKALSDEEATALGDAIRTSDILATVIVRSHDEDAQTFDHNKHEHTQLQISSAADGAFNNLRQYFRLIGDTDMVDEFDAAEQSRKELMRIRYGHPLP